MGDSRNRLALEAGAGAGFLPRRLCSERVVT